MANRYRGEATLEIDGTAHTLRLTLGALANLEAALGVENLSALIAVLLAPNLSSTTLQLVLKEALFAGGDMDCAQADALLNSAAKPLALGQAYVALMRASFAP